MLSFFRKKPSIDDEIKKKKLEIAIHEQESRQIVNQLIILEKNLDKIKQRVTDRPPLTVADRVEAARISKKRIALLKHQAIVMNNITSGNSWIDKYREIKQAKTEIQSAQSVGLIIENELEDTFNMEQAKNISKIQYGMEKMQTTASSVLEDVALLRDSTPLVDVPLRDMEWQSDELKELNDVEALAIEDSMTVTPNLIDQEIFHNNRRYHEIQLEKQRRSTVVSTTDKKKL
jgi:hypothetical protein